MSCEDPACRCLLDLERVRGLSGMRWATVKHALFGFCAGVFVSRIVLGPETPEGSGFIRADWIVVGVIGASAALFYWLRREEDRAHQRHEDQVIDRHWGERGEREGKPGWPEFQERLQNARLR